MKKPLRYVQFSIKYFYLLLFFSLDLFFVSAQNIDFGKSFVNITKGTNGGTVRQMISWK